ncbi:MAG TPA: DUF362 domain-containing protein [Bacteroidota bacterium]|nr:DUF362 domain-containing protein [Bacteroidota bacterium]
MHPRRKPRQIDRREFVKLMAVGGIAAAIPAVGAPNVFTQEKTPPPKPATNVKDAMSVARTPDSMPGKRPGAVVQVSHAKSVANDKIDQHAVDAMVRKGMLELTGAASIAAAWTMFVTPEDIVGLKVNPVAGKTLSTSIEITNAVIGQLEEAGIPRKNIVIWDRREFELEEAGFTRENFPGIRIVGTEQKDAKGSYTDAQGVLYGKHMIDESWYYWADVEEKYDAETMPYMVNEGKYSYFGKICTQQVTKIINIPILKNAGPTVTLALKNLAFGAITNTGRLHKSLWAETCAEVPAFAPLRDKVVLNIVDGIRGCFNGGPAADPKFFTEYKTVLVGTDPVAVDRIGYEIVLKKRIEEKIQKAEVPAGRKFMDLAQGLGLGTADLDKITLQRLSLG